MKEGWEIKSLNEVCQIRPPKKEAKEIIDEDDIVSFVPMDTLSTNEKYFIPHGEKKLKDVISAYTFFKDNDVLLAKITPCFENGKLGIAKNLKNGIGFGSSEFIVYRPSNILNADFLYYFLAQTSFRNIGASRMTGAVGHKRIPKDFYEDFPIPIPPLPEQQQIVAILDKAFAAIDQAKANVERNLENAKELFQSRLEEVFSRKGEGWEEKVLGEIIEIKNGKNQKAVLSKMGKYKIMGSAGNTMGYATDFICEAGTTIIGRKGNISKPIYINERFWNVDTAFGFYPKNENDLDTRFVYYLCLGIDFKSMDRGTTIPSLVKSELQTIQIRFPKSLIDQQSIVQKLDTLSAETKILETIYQTKITDLEELKKSVLQKAFSGELTV